MPIAEPDDDVVRRLVDAGNGEVEMSVEIEIRGHNPTGLAVSADGTIFFIVESSRPKGERVTAMHEFASRARGPCSSFTPPVRGGEPADVSG